MEQYNKLLETLRAMHIEVLKKNVLDDPTLLGDYMVRMRGYAEFLVPYVNQALSDADDKLMRCETERNRIYKEAIDAGESQNAASSTRRRLMLVKARTQQPLSQKKILVYWMPNMK